MPIHPLLAPLAQFLLSDNPDMRQIYRYAVLVPIAILVSLVIIYLVRRRAMNNARSLTSMSGGFMSLDRMRKDGLITDEEYRAMRQKMADRHLKEAERDSKKPEELAALALTPELARELVTHPPDERVRASLAGLGRRFDERDVEEFRRRWQAVDAGVGVGSAPPAKDEVLSRDGASGPSSPPEETRPNEKAARSSSPVAPPLRDYGDDPDFVPGDPLSVPRRASEAPPSSRTEDRAPAEPAPAPASQRNAPPPPTAPSSAPASPAADRASEIEDLYARGVISTEEYLRLRDLVRREGTD